MNDTDKKLREAAQEFKAGVSKLKGIESVTISGPGHKPVTLAGGAAKAEPVEIAKTAGGEKVLADPDTGEILKFHGNKYKITGQGADKEAEIIQDLEAESDRFDIERIIRNVLQESMAKSSINYDSQGKGSRRLYWSELRHLWIVTKKTGSGMFEEYYMGSDFGEAVARLAGEYQPELFK